MKGLSILCLALLLLGLTGCETTATNASRPFDVRPAPRIRVAPDYPLAMRQMGITGTAVVEFIVDTNGDVLNPFVIQATNEAFGQAAAACIARWKFTPARKDGRPVTTKMQQTISFNMNE